MPTGGLMRPFCGAACAAFLLVSALVLAEQTPKPVRGHAKASAAQKIQIVSGPSKRTVYASPMTSPEHLPANGVVIYNGNQKQTRIFNAAIDPGTPVQNLPPAVIAVVTAESKSESTKPVVVGISSSHPDTQPVVVNIASSGSSSQPVVLGVASSGFQAAGAVDPVAVAVSPRPAKRPPYRPASLDRQ